MGHYLVQTLRHGFQQLIAIVLKLLLAVAALVGCADLRSTRGNAANLDTYELGMLPKLSEFRRLGKRQDEPFVMINLLKFKEQASGQDFEDLSGEQAYRLYLKGMTRAQSDIGSRLIWAGRIQQPP